MSYSVRFRKRAAKEYLETIEWYKQRSLQAAENFVLNVQLPSIQLKSNLKIFVKHINIFMKQKQKNIHFHSLFY